MNPFNILTVLGVILAFVGILMAVPGGVAWYFGSNDLRPLLLSSLITTLTGYALWLAFRRRATELKIRDGFVIVSSGWIVASLFGALPFVLSGQIPSFTDAFFETVSGFTTTGATIIADIEALTPG
ncbi:MAG: potassium transporter TrkG, partial [Bacteroidota bacterium]